jgi:hypothetical protein
MLLRLTGPLPLLRAPVVIDQFITPSSHPPHPIAANPTFRCHPRRPPRAQQQRQQQQQQWQMVKKRLLSRSMASHP